MSTEVRQAIFSAVRSILIVIGSIVTTNGYVDDATVQAATGAVMVILPIIWGVVDKVQAERSAKVREVVAMNVGIVVADNTVGKTPIVMPVDVPKKIADVSPTLPAVLTESLPAIQSTEGVKL